MILRHVIIKIQISLFKMKKKIFIHIIPLIKPLLKIVLHIVENRAGT